MTPRRTETPLFKNSSSPAAATRTYPGAGEVGFPTLSPALNVTGGLNTTRPVPTLFSPTLVPSSPSFPNTSTAVAITTPSLLAHPTSSSTNSSTVALFHTVNKPPSTSSITTHVKTSSSAVSKPSIAAKVGKYIFKGCYIDGKNGAKPLARILPLQHFFKGTLTPEKCAKTCEGYKLFGLAWSDECHCGNNVAGTKDLDPVQAHCNYLCDGDPDQICGGSWRLNLYELEE
ncbi:hypothetical protein BP5796_03411 [Coleophoma crateriformis]|uniref:WSC domain-containing protein n=1 Tax=Coleophoma crateriformis TaxID=565419 RepID=A0A3D8SN26_9HELO|nr:hypothetical protein BP5796_03411 [Coleophoma crateriformis]